ncbi:MAG: hypothetical protein WD267_10270 [Balneolales bacterium]
MLILLEIGSDKEYGIGQSETTNQNLNLREIDWYVFNENYGTSEEKYFVRYINKVYDQLKSSMSKFTLFGMNGISRFIPSKKEEQLSRILFYS